MSKHGEDVCSSSHDSCVKAGGGDLASHALHGEQFRVADSGHYALAIDCTTDPYYSGPVQPWLSNDEPPTSRGAFMMGVSKTGIWPYGMS